MRARGEMEMDSGSGIRSLLISDSPLSFAVGFLFLLVFLQTSNGQSKASLQRSPPDTDTLIQSTDKILKNFIWYL